MLIKSQNLNVLGEVEWMFDGIEFELKPAGAAPPQEPKGRALKSYWELRFNN